jgi:hypothetical protein
MSRIKDYLSTEEREFRHIEKRPDIILEDVLHSNIKEFLTDCCFYYSAGSDATPIVECLDIVNKFIYCDIQEYSNFNESLYKLKGRLKENNCIEQCYCTLEPEWFRLNERTYKGHYGLRSYFNIHDLKAEFSLWKKDNKYFILIYIDFDNNVIWQNIFLKYQIAPKMICNYCYEGGVDFEFAPISEEMKPEYWLGYGQHIDGYELYKKVNYSSNYGDPGQKIDLYKRQKKEDNE